MGLCNLNEAVNLLKQVNVTNLHKVQAKYHIQNAIFWPKMPIYGRKPQYWPKLTKIFALRLEKVMICIQ